MHNVYRLNGTLVSKVDRRQTQKVTHDQLATGINDAFDQAEKHFAKECPNEDITLSMGNRQPVQLRPGFQQAG